MLLKAILFAIALAATAVRAVAQEPAPPPATDIPAPPPACCVIPAGTPVELEVTQVVSTKIHVRGDRFTLRLVRPIVVDGVELLPADVPGVGEVVHASKAGMAGKAAELIVAARYLSYGDVKIPLRSFSIVTHSKSQSDEAMVAMMAVSVVGLLVKADETRVTSGARATAKVAAPTTIPPRDATAPSPAAPPAPPEARNPTP